MQTGAWKGKLLEGAGALLENTGKEDVQHREEYRRLPRPRNRSLARLRFRPGGSQIGDDRIQLVGNCEQGTDNEATGRVLAEAPAA